MAALVGAASTQDRDGVAPLLARDTGSKTRHLWLDSAYEGRGVRAVRERGWTAEVVRRSGERGHGQWRHPQMPLFTARRGFELVRRRWVVERTFAWLGRNRRLSKDYEARTDVSEAMIWVAMTRLLVRRLAYP
jgi:transposase